MIEFEERRQEPRKQTALHAFVSDRTGAIDLKCAIRDISRSGCRIASSYVEDLPRVIEVMPEGFEKPLTGKIVWRTSKFAGVQFISAAEASELERRKRLRPRAEEPAGFFARLRSFMDLRRSAGLTVAEGRAARARRQDDFASGVLHGIRNPLTAIKGLLGLLTGDSVLPMPRKARSVINAAYRNAEKADHLVEQALRTQGVRSGELPCEPEPTDVVGLASEALLANTGFAALYDVRFELNDEVGQAMVEADARRLEEVLGHLLAHAAEASPKGETVMLSLSRQAGRIRLAVSDGGLGKAAPEAATDGMSPLEDLAGQSAQWLRLCHAILERHGTALQVDTRPGSGTTAWFDLKESA